MIVIVIVSMIEIVIVIVIVFGFVFMKAYSRERKIMFPSFKRKNLYSLV